MSDRPNFTRNILNDPREWHIHSRLIEDDYVLYAPDGSKVGHYKSLEDAKQAARDLQQLALDSPRPDNWLRESK